MKNIAIVVTSLSFGGAERFVITLYNMLIQLGYNVTILLICNKIDYEISDVKYYTLDNEITLKYKFLKPYFLQKYIETHHIDLIIDNRTRLSFFKTIVYEFFLRKVKKVKIIHANKLDVYLFSNKFITENIYNRYKKIICINTEMQSLVLSKYKLKNVITIYNPIPEIDNSDADIAIKESFILFFGRIDNQSKDLLFLLESYKKSELIGKNIQLVILGSGPDLLGVKNKAQELKITNYVNFIPATSNPFPYVKRAMFTVITSNYEGFCLAALESIAIGTPVVSVNYGKIATEIIQNQHNGLLVDKDMNKFINALNLMATDKELREYCKKNGPVSVNQFNKENIVLLWKKALENI